MENKDRETHLRLSGFGLVDNFSAEGPKDMVSKAMTKHLQILRAKGEVNKRIHRAKRQVLLAQAELNLAEEITVEQILNEWSHKKIAARYAQGKP